MDITQGIPIHTWDDYAKKAVSESNADQIRKRQAELHLVCDLMQSKIDPKLRALISAFRIKPKTLFSSGNLVMQVTVEFSDEKGRKVSKVIKSLTVRPMSKGDINSLVAFLAKQVSKAIKQHLAGSKGEKKSTKA